MTTAPGKCVWSVHCLMLQNHLKMRGLGLPGLCWGRWGCCHLCRPAAGLPVTRHLQPGAKLRVNRFAPGLPQEGIHAGRGGKKKSSSCPKAFPPFYGSQLPACRPPPGPPGGAAAGRAASPGPRSSGLAPRHAPRLGLCVPARAFASRRSEELQLLKRPWGPGAARPRRRPGSGCPPLLCPASGCRMFSEKRQVTHTRSSACGRRCRRAKDTLTPQDAADPSLPAPTPAHPDPAGPSGLVSREAGVEDMVIRCQVGPPFGSAARFS